MQEPPTKTKSRLASKLFSYCHFFLSFFYDEEIVQHAGFGVFNVTIRNWETEPVFKSGVDHCVDWWQRTRGDPIPGFKYWNSSTYVNNHA